MNGSEGRLSVPGWMRDLVRATDVEQVTELIVDAVFAESLAAFRDDAALVDAFRSSARINVDRCMLHIADGVPLDGPASAAMPKLAALYVERGVTEATIQSAHRVGARELLGQWMCAIGRWRDADGHEPADALWGIGALQIATFESQDDVLAQAVGAYRAALEAALASDAVVRRRVVRAYLAGDSSLGAQELGDALQYPVAETHLAIVCTTAGGEVPEELDELVRAAVAPARTLVSWVGPEQVAIWCARPEAWGWAPIDVLQRRLEAAGITASIGGSSAGVEGLRASFDEAMSVEAVRAALATDAPRVMSFDEFRLEAWALGDPEQARRFVHAELAGLADESAASARLRETLMAWFATGSHVSAAAQLGVHESTVRNHIRRSEELVGRPMGVRRTELQVGLRLRRLVA